MLRAPNFKFKEAARTKQSRTPVHMSILPSMHVSTPGSEFQANYVWTGYCHAAINIPAPPQPRRPTSHITWLIGSATNSTLAMYFACRLDTRTCMSSKCMVFAREFPYMISAYLGLNLYPDTHLEFRKALIVRTTLGVPCALVAQCWKSVTKHGR